MSASRNATTRILFFLCAYLVFAATIGTAMAQQKEQPKKPQSVIVSSIVKKDYADKVEALGTLRANETVVLTATVTEAVTAINFTDGQRVNEGDILIEMTRGEEKANLDAEQAVVNESQRQLERIQPLIESGAISKSILDERKRDAQAALARLNSLKSRISDRVITAPFAGIVGLRNISVGTVLQPGMQITTLDDDSIMKLDFSVPSVFLSALKPGLEIIAKTNSFTGKTFTGKISSIDTQIDPNTRSIMARAEIPNDEKLLKPGLLMSVVILKNPRRALIAPEESIVSEGKKSFVYVVSQKDNATIVSKKEVTLGTRQPGEVEIITGLTEGDKVVTHGTLNVSDGAAISIKAEDDGTKTIGTMLAPTPAK